MSFPSCIDQLERGLLLNVTGDIRGSTTGKIALISRGNLNVFEDAVKITGREQPTRIHLIGVGQAFLLLIGPGIFLPHWNFPASFAEIALSRKKIMSLGNSPPSPL